METKFHILAAEDDPADVLFLKRLLTHAGIGRVDHVPDGRAALSYLFGEGKYADRHLFPLPQVLLLDIHLPGLSGYDVLARLDARRRFPALKTFLITGFVRDDDRVRAGALGIDGLFEKPLSLGHIAEMAQAVTGRVRV